MAEHNDQQQGGTMLNINIPTDDLIAHKRQVEKDKGLTDSEASLVVIWEIMGPFIKMAWEELELEKRVSAYRRSEFEKIQKKLSSE